MCRPPFMYREPQTTSYPCSISSSMRPTIRRSSERSAMITSVASQRASRNPVLMALSAPRPNWFLMVRTGRHGQLPVFPVRRADDDQVAAAEHLVGGHESVLADVHVGAEHFLRFEE